MKKTKIICSIGPSTQKWENFKGLVDAGMNVARINFSHATMEERKIDEELVERANKELGTNIAILFDTKGPDLRTCTFDGDYIDLVEDQVVLYTQSSIDGKKNCYIYNLDNKKESVISNEVGEIESLCKIGNVVYFIGTKGEGLRSLYSIDITNNKLDRLVYDFPKNISEKSKLIVVGDNIYFLGFNDSKEKNALYRYNLKEKSIKLIDSNKGQYIIIK